MKNLTGIICILFLLVSCKEKKQGLPAYHPRSELTYDTALADKTYQEHLDSIRKTEASETFKILSKQIDKNGKCVNCDFEKLGDVGANIHALDYQKIYSFLCTIDSSCFKNVEFSEYSNELLFKLVEHYPGDFVEILSSYPELQKKYLFHELSAPLMNNDIAGIQKAISNTDGDEKVKGKILNALKQAK